MAKVRTFRITPRFGIPDREVTEFLEEAEKEMGVITVTTCFIPALGTSDPRFNVIVTKLDDPIIAD